MRSTFGPSEKLDRPTRWVALLGFLGLLVMSVATMADVLLRWILNTPLDGVDDVSRLGLAVIIAAAFPAGLLQNQNVTIRFLGKACGRRCEYWLESFGVLLTLVFFVIVSWQIFALAIDDHATGNTTMSIELATWPWWAVVAIIFLLCLPVQAAVFLGHLRRAVHGGGPGGTIDQTDYAILLGHHALDSTSTRDGH